MSSRGGGAGFLLWRAKDGQIVLDIGLEKESGDSCFPEVGIRCRL